MAVIINKHKNAMITDYIFTSDKTGEIKAIFTSRYKSAKPLKITPINAYYYELEEFLKEWKELNGLS